MRPRCELENHSLAMETAFRVGKNSNVDSSPLLIPVQILLFVRFMTAGRRFTSMTLTDVRTENPQVQEN